MRIIMKIRVTKTHCPTLKSFSAMTSAERLWSAELHEHIFDHWVGSEKTELPLPNMPSVVHRLQILVLDTHEAPSGPHSLDGVQGRRVGREAKHGSTATENVIDAWMARRIVANQHQVAPLLPCPLPDDQEIHGTERFESWTMGFRNPYFHDYAHILYMYILFCCHLLKWMYFYGIWITNTWIKVSYFLIQNLRFWNWKPISKI